MKGFNSVKVIFILILVILLLLGILVIKILKPNSSSNTNFESLSPEEIREKMLSGLSYKNYTITYKVDGDTITKKVKDNIIVVMDKEAGTYSWNDCSTKESIAGNTKTGKYVKTPVTDASLFNKHFLHIEDNLKSYGDNLYHVRNEKYNRKDCLVIEAGKDRGETYWVDSENGFVLKYEATDGTKCEFTFKLDNVTNEDIKKPSNYTSI